MYKNIERLQQTKGSKHFNFLPKTFILPAEYAEFSATFNKQRGKRHKIEAFDFIVPTFAFAYFKLT